MGKGNNQDVDQGGGIREGVTSTIAALSMVGKSQKEIGELVGLTKEGVRRRVMEAEDRGLMTGVRDEMVRQVMDPVREKLEGFAVDAVDELWQLREEADSEKLKKDILVDILHMAGYRPHTSADKVGEDLPTIMIGEMNINQGGSGQSPQSTAIEVTSEVTDARALREREEKRDTGGADVEVALDQGIYFQVEEDHDSGDDSGLGRA
jgi:hypothetical protein